MTTRTVAAGLIPCISIYADHAVTTLVGRFVQGIAPLIGRALAVGHPEAFLSREQIAEATGLCATYVIPSAYPQQLAQAGVVTMSSQGEFALVEREDGSYRGNACGWVMDWDAYTPTAIPELELVTEPYLIDIDHDAVAAAMAPGAHPWAKETRAHRLAMALLHHADLTRVRLTPQEAAKVLGRSRVTGWRALKDLERLELAAPDGDGWWVDLSVLFYDPAMTYPDPLLAPRSEDAKLLREAVFTTKGWEVVSVARIARETLARLRGLPGLLASPYTAAVGRSMRSSVLLHMREVRDDPYAWGGRPEGI